MLPEGKLWFPWVPLPVWFMAMTVQFAPWVRLETVWLEQRTKKTASVRLPQGKLLLPLPLVPLQGKERLPEWFVGWEWFPLAEWFEAPNKKLQFATVPLVLLRAAVRLAAWQVMVKEVALGRVPFPLWVWFPDPVWLEGKLWLLLLPPPTMNRKVQFEVWFPLVPL